MLELVGTAFCVGLLGMSKGGFSVGPLALPLLILIWSGRPDPAKSVVSFLLPLLCLMDVVAVGFYRKHVQWRRIVPLLPPALVGIVLASLLFMRSGTGVISLSDRWLKLTVGTLGILFVIWHFARGRVTPGLKAAKPGRVVNGCIGFVAGVTSTLAHAAGPLAQMYFLQQKFDKMKLAATLVGFFWCLNLLKLVPFILLGRVTVGNLGLAALMLPMVPLGVGAGYLIVRTVKASVYFHIVYVLLFVASVVLIGKAL